MSIKEIEFRRSKMDKLAVWKFSKWTKKCFSVKEVGEEVNWDFTFLTVELIAVNISQKCHGQEGH